MASFAGIDPSLTPPPIPFVMLNLYPNAATAKKKAPAIAASVVLTYLTMRYVVGYNKSLIFWWGGRGAILVPYIIWSGYSFVLNKAIYGDNGVYLW